MGETGHEKEGELRVDLAAAFRMAARHGWHEAVANHFSAAVSADGKQFLMNPLWRHFAAIRASELGAEGPSIRKRTVAYCTQY